MFDLGETVTSLQRTKCICHKGCGRERRDQWSDRDDDGEEGALREEGQSIEGRGKGTGLILWD